MSSKSADSVVLRTAKGVQALPLLRVLISGMASRQNLSVEQLDDLQLAVESLLAQEAADGSYVSLEVTRRQDGLGLCLDGLANENVRRALLEPPPPEEGQAFSLDIRTLLESLTDGFTVVEGSNGYAVQMEKRA